MSTYRIDVIAGAEGGDEFHLRPGDPDAANGPPLARCRVRRSAGQVPRFWYYVGQLAFAATQLSHHRRDRMLVLTNDFIECDELIDIDWSADAFVPLGAFLDAVAQVSGSDHGLVVEVPGVREHGQNVFWAGLGAHFCELDPEQIRRRFPLEWSAHVAALLPKQPVLVSQLSDAAQAALGMAGAGGEPLLSALTDIGFRQQRHVNLLHGGPVFERPASLDVRLNANLAVDPSLSRGDCHEWLLCAGDSNAHWLLPGSARGGKLLTCPAYADALEKRLGNSALRARLLGGTATQLK